MLWETLILGLHMSVSYCRHAPPKVLFKSDTAANRSGWDLNHTWSTYTKVEPPPPNVGRVLQFTARGDDGIDYTLLPLNRIVDQVYTAHFNIVPLGRHSCHSSMAGQVCATAEPHDAMSGARGSKKE